MPDSAALLAADFSADPAARRRAVIDLFVDAGMTPDTYVGHWDQYCQWLRSAMASAGLRSDSHLLDIGCGAGRAAVAALSTLTDGEYCGIDEVPAFAQITRRLLAPTPMRHRVIEGGDFDFEQFGIRFDMAVAHSLFPHIEATQIEACFSALRDVMAPGGVFLFTFISQENVAGYGHLYSGSLPMIRSRAVTENFITTLIQGMGLTAERASIKHPIQQVWLVRF
jgi:cyclopropane fatty-acyl-phospholipid synthase-like methyltransferase